METVIGFLIVVNCFLIGIIISIKIDSGTYEDICQLYLKEIVELRIKLTTEQIKNKP